MDTSTSNVSSGDHSFENQLNGAMEKNRPPSPPPISDLHSNRGGRRRLSRSRSRSRGNRFEPRFKRRMPFSPIRHRSRNRSRSRSRDRRMNRDRSPLEFNRGRRSRSRSRGRRPWQRRPQTPPVPPPPPPSMVPGQVYVPQPLYGDPQQQQQPPPQQFYGQGYVPMGQHYAPGYNQFNQYVPPYSQPNYNAGWEPPPPGVPEPAPVPSVGPMTPIEEDRSKNEAVEAEMIQQKATLRKQRDDYMTRSVALKKEMKILKEQRHKLTSISGEPPSPTTKSFLKENDRLQSQIENKLSTIDNVIDMLTGIIGKDGGDGEERPAADEKVEKKKKRKTKSKKRSAGSSSSSSSSTSSSSESASESSEDSEPEKLKSKVIESILKRKEMSKNANSADKVKATANTVEEVTLEKRINYAFYDPETHWCRYCDVFPKSAKDYLNHLHSKEHLDHRKSSEAPWHENNPNVEMPSYGDAPTKRIPIRGLQFFVPATSWYCKICSIWMGDLHCASLHLKSNVHAESYSRFLKMNPQFEVDWMVDRQLAYNSSARGAGAPGNSKSSVSSGEPAMFESIPLQISAATRTISEPGEKKTAAKKKKDKKAKKAAAKKKGKKKQSSSSSSSSSSTSSDSDSSDSNSGAKKTEEVRPKLEFPMKLSIRNSMRTLEKLTNTVAKRDVASSWAPATSAPAVAAPAASGFRFGKRYVSDEDEAIEKEEDVEWFRKRDDRDRPRSPGAGAYDSRRRGDYNRGPDRQYRRRTTRSRSRSPYRFSKQRRRSPPSLSPSRSRSRSRGRNSRRIERPVVVYPPEFKARTDKKFQKQSTRPEMQRSKKSPINRKPTVTATAEGKKLPFIGRMPVFKKHQSVDEVQPKDEDVEKPQERVEEKKAEEPKVSSTTNNDIDKSNSGRNDDDELMPDPNQLIMLMGGHHRSAPNVHDEEILPPGIDQSEVEPEPAKPPNLLMPRKGPLPQDLEDALNILFPGEKQPETEPARKPFIVTGHVKDNGTEIITGPEPADEVTHNTEEMYKAFAAYGGEHNPELWYDVGSGTTTTTTTTNTTTDPITTDVTTTAATATAEVNVCEPLPATGATNDVVAMVEEGQASEVVQHAIDVAPTTELPPSEVRMQPKMSMEEMDDLAMLGIDASDLAAQCI